MKPFIDAILPNIPIILILIVLICLIYSEFAGICVGWDKMMEIFHNVFIGHGVKVLG
jgi:hypothetical protein